MATLQSEEISRHTAIWYFAYGSNMRSSVMSGRGIVPLAAVTVVVPTHVLTFDIFGIPYSEPSFVSIAEVEHVDAADGKDSTTPLTRIHRPPVHGVAYLLSQEDYHRLVITEGGTVGYDVVELRAEVLDEDRSQNTSSPGKRQIVVQTLKAKYPWRPNRAPSARYKGLLMSGSVEHGLPSTYNEFLRGIPVYSQPKGWRRNLGRQLFLFLWRPLHKTLVQLVKSQLDEAGSCPKWIGSVTVAFYRLMWAHHDYVHSLLWGRGDS